MPRAALSSLIAFDRRTTLSGHTLGPPNTRRCPLPRPMAHFRACLFCDGSALRFPEIPVSNTRPPPFTWAVKMALRVFASNTSLRAAPCGIDRAALQARNYSPERNELPRWGALPEIFP